MYTEKTLIAVHVITCMSVSLQVNRRFFLLYLLQICPTPLKFDIVSITMLEETLLLSVGVKHDQFNFEYKATRSTCEVKKSNYKGKNEIKMLSN